MPPNYNLGKIYKIVDNNNNLCYIGSTIKTLNSRFSEHRNCYKKNPKAGWSVFQIFDTYGIDKCHIELLENFPCENREALCKQEGHYILTTENVNKNLAGRGNQESKANWRVNNPTYHKEYNIINKDKIKTQRAIRYQLRKTQSENK